APREERCIARICKVARPAVRRFAGSMEHVSAYRSERPDVPIFRPGATREGSPDRARSQVRALEAFCPTVGTCLRCARNGGTRASWQAGSFSIAPLIHS